LNYIHTNPMQEHWNLVSKPEEYKFSSASFYEIGDLGDVTITHYKDYF
jgi:putative transposase